MTTLALIFQKQAIQNNFQPDSLQKQVIQQLEALEASLQSKKVAPLTNYYLWGPVGRGKSWLLNTFFEASSISQKKRFHFHSFFKQLHQAIYKHSQQKNSIDLALNELIGDSRLICFDEFHVHDIGDAMLIKPLFNALFKRKIALITTSNYAPDNLLSDPLYHDRFLPAINLIKERMNIINIDGNVDYRTLPTTHRQGFTAGYFVTPGTLKQRHKLNLPHYTQNTITLKIGNQHLTPTQHTENQITFNFEALCESNTSSNDYLTLAEQFDTWIIDNTPALSQTSIGAQQRFINLIDILYDQNKCLYLITQSTLEELLANTIIGDMTRTYSRLNQLQKC